MATPLLVLIILAIVIIASIITSVVTYVILSGRNKRIRLAEQYRQLGITEQYLKIQDEIERIIRYKDIKLTTASPVKMSNPEDGQNEKETESGTFANDLWFIVRGKDRKTSEKLLEYWHFICENSEWKCIERKEKRLKIRKTDRLCPANLLRMKQIRRAQSVGFIFCIILRYFLFFDSFFLINFLL